MSNVTIEWIWRSGLTEGTDEEAFWKARDEWLDTRPPLVKKLFLSLENRLCETGYPSSTVVSVKVAGQELFVTGVDDDDEENPAILVSSLHPLKHPQSDVEAAETTLSLTDTQFVVWTFAEMVERDIWQAEIVDNAPEGGE
jgi:hypothetical protein